MSVVFIYFCLMNQLPIPTPLPSLDNLQLRMLVEKSEEQLNEMKKLIKLSRKDAESLRDLANTAGKLAEGLDRHLVQFEDSSIYEKALVELQKENNFSSTFAESENLRNKLSHRDESEHSQQGFDGFKEFQKRSVQAHSSDLKDLEQIQRELEGAPPGYLNKVQTQLSLRQWQTETRISSQMTELLATMKSMREELRALRLKDQSAQDTQKSIINRLKSAWEPTREKP